ncbi:unnamed protein product [Pleuronectes platessa]|uniref:Uncharacterized protein n=1 Tax=Pleuronectes platessa TaxID=8262 RepID=A0A9N7VYD3_PLEPL|nr:unnamed protein product [Pleuronectes platessa]
MLGSGNMLGAAPRSEAPEHRRGAGKKLHNQPVTSPAPSDLFVFPTAPSEPRGRRQNTERLTPPGAERSLSRDWQRNKPRPCRGLQLRLLRRPVRVRLPPSRGSTGGMLPVNMCGPVSSAARNASREDAPFKTMTQGWRASQQEGVWQQGGEGTRGIQAGTNGLIKGLVELRGDAAEEHLRRHPHPPKG